MTGKKRGPIASVCAQCGGGFHAWPYQLANDQGKFCQMACYRASRRRRVEHVCEMCGSPFTTWPCRSAAAAVKYCGLECSAKGLSRPGRRSREYRIWHDMKQRCLNPTNRSYPDYGGRGIGISDAWRDSFDQFLADMGQRPSSGHTIERRANHRGYSAENCYWATYAAQNRNRRGNRLLTHNGVTQCLTDWAKQYGIHPNTLWDRLKRGVPLDEALIPPSPSPVRMRLVRYA